ncbi:MAG TPA: AAA family ATPase [Candidatus Binatia bacterium]|jgi:tetratricopeptide (TPR) repeat protein|nr:AAA family ATPase [Candidatus Binatia bacterium]
MRFDEPAFVGRSRELDVLAAALDDARAGRGRFVLLLGDGGIGKTRTVEEFVRSAACPPERVLWGRCPEQEGAPAYWPWIRALQSYVETCDPAALARQVGSGAGALARLVPALAVRLPGLTPARTADEPRFLLFDAVAGFLARASADEPLVLVFDDLHWADESSLLLLAFVTRELRGCGLLIVATSRRELQRGPRALTDLTRVGRTVVLDGLAAEAAADLVRQAGADDPPAPELMARLLATSDGNPLFLLELLRALRDDGDRGTPDVVLPEGLRASIRGRIEPLAPEARALVSLAAVIGRDFELAVLAIAAGLTPDATLVGLTPAVEAGLVDQHDDGGAFRFRHALVREAVYGDLLPAARAGLHRRVGLGIERLRSATDVDASVAELAVHFFHAAPLGEAERAVDYASRAGALATARLAHADAVANYERALRACSLGGIDDERVVRLWLALGDAAHRAGDARRAQEAHERAARWARGRGDARAFADAALGAYRTSGRYGVHDRVVRLLEEALPLVGDEDAERRAALLAALALGLHFADDDGARRDACSAEAVAVARRAGTPRALAAALGAHHMTLLSAEDLPARVAITAEGFRLTGPGSAPPWLQSCHIIDLLEAGDTAAAEQQVDIYAHRAERSGLPHLRWHARVLRGTLALLAGRFADAERLAADALASRRDGRDPAADHVFFLASFGRRRETTGTADLEQHNRALIDAAPTVVPWRCTLGLLHLDAGRRDEARRVVDMLVPHDLSGIPRNAHYVSVLWALAELTSGLGDARRAALVYEQLRPFDGRTVVVHTFTVLCQGAVARYLGLLAAATGDVSAAERHFEDALAMNARMGAWPQLAHTQHDLARLLLPRDAERAMALADQARRTAETLGMPRLLQQMDGLAKPVAPVSDAGQTVVARLQREGEYWTVAYAGTVVRLRHAKGIGFLRQLLANPGREFHVLELAAEGEPGERPAESGDAGEVLDRDARAAYKRRLADLRCELDEARRFDDAGRVARAEREAEFLGRELARGVGLGGRERRAASDAERARVNLSRTIQAIVKKIAAENPALGQVLLASVHTGLFCTYEPDPRLRLRWEL